LWQQFGGEGAATRGEFDAYFAGATSGVAVVLGKVRVVRPAVSLEDARLRGVGFRPPQSWVVLGEGSALAGMVGW
jgi:predicted transcriptional regulator